MTVATALAARGDTGASAAVPDPRAPFVVIYTRISVADINHARNLARGTSGAEFERLMRQKVEAHAQECRDFAAHHGLVVGYEDSDNNRSASRYSTKNLPGRERVLERIREHAGQRVILITTEIPRLLRKNEDAGLFVSVIARPHVVIMCTQGDPEGEGDRYDLNTAKGRERFHDAVNRAEAESAAISERRRRKERNRASAGHFWGNAPFGYRKTYVDDAGAENTQGRGTYTGSLRVIEDEAAEIRAAAATIIEHDGGRPRPGAKPGEPWDGSLRQVVLDWNARGLTGRSGRPWTQATLRQLLLNPTLAGYRIHRAGDNDGRADRASEGRRRRGVWPPILDDDTFTRLIATLDGDGRRRGRGSNARKHGGVGLVWAPCGALCKVHVSPGHKRAGDGSQVRYRSYVCPDPAAGGDRCVRRDADAVDALMFDYVNWWLEPGGDYDRYLELVRARGDLAGQLADADAEVARLEQEQRNTAAEAARGGEAQRQMAYQISAEIGRQLDELAIVRDALRAAMAGQAEALAPAKPVHADVWRQWPPEQQNAWLRRFIGKVTIQPTGRGRRVFDPHEVTVEPGRWADDIGRSTITAPALASRPGRHEDAVAAWLADHPAATAREIAAGTGISVPSVYPAVDALEARGRLIRERTGRGRGGGKVSMRFTLTS